MASLGILTSGVAHEINNPLNYLMGAQFGLAKYFEKHETSDKEQTDFLLSSIKTGVERISNIVKGLNQFSRNNERLDESCDLHSILDNCFVMLQSQTINKIAIIKKYSKELFSISGNSGKLHQVFLNILNNYTSF